MTPGVSSLETFTIIRPELTVDVTDVAECIVDGTSVSALALVRRFAPRTTNAAAVRGMLINAMFDHLVVEPDMADDDLLHHVIQLRPLSYTAAGQSVNIDSVRASIPALREAVRMWEGKSIQVEPFVVSKRWGLQGRFDILVESDDGVELIEMKSGSVPARGVRSNHMAQVSAYALLYAELDRAPLKSVSVWYVGDKEHPFRNLKSDVVHAMQERVVQTRNEIVEAEIALSVRDFTPLRSLTGRTTAAAGPAASFEQTLVEAYRNSDVVSRTVAQSWISFLQQEQFANKVGSGRVSTQLSNLTIDEVKSDVDRKHLYFNTASSVTDTAIRVGDQISLRPSSAIRSSLLYKGSVRSIDEHHVDVTLRNKQADIGTQGFWELELDASDTSTRQLYPGIIEFLDQNETQRLLLIGATAPVSVTAPSKVDTAQTGIGGRTAIDTHGLFDDQRNVVERALSSRDLFFIQGPPGTGKTSAVLRSIVRNILNDVNERVLIVAYTNRAVAEICDVLARELPADDKHAFLRHGSKLGMLTTQTTEHSIPHLAQTMPPDELAEKIRASRCIVSTIHSMHSSPEIFAFGGFTTLVVDEASQALAVHIIGLMSRVQRSILIGDQCQLPAVVTQPPDQLTLNSELLGSLGMHDLGVSYFDRMISLYRKNGWHWAVGELGSQGRMHADVMKFPSEECYSGRLKPIHDWQKSTSPLPWVSVLPKRSVFLPVTPDVETQAEAEAALIADITGRIFTFADEENIAITLGIITPFRVQNTRVISMLDKRLRERVLVDTVERFQGSECDVIIYGTAVSSDAEFQAIRSEFAVNGRQVDRKLNVACTRARHQFVLVGDPLTLRLSASYANFIAMSGN